jgi:hypothetical protein
MSLHIPSDVANIILEYYAQLRDMKWTPFIEPKTGKLKWKTNKYSAKYDNMNNLLKHRKDNLRLDKNIEIVVVQNYQTIDRYNTTGTSICLKTDYYMDKEYYPIYHSYIEYVDESNVKYSTLCLSSPIEPTFKLHYDVYKDSNIDSTLINILLLDMDSLSLILEK